MKTIYAVETDRGYLFFKKEQSAVEYATKHNIGAIERLAVREDDYDDDTAFSDSVVVV